MSEFVSSGPPAMCCGALGGNTIIIGCWLEYLTHLVPNSVINRLNSAELFDWALLWNAQRPEIEICQLGLQCCAATRNPILIVPLFVDIEIITGWQSFRQYP